MQRRQIPRVYRKKTIRWVFAVWGPRDMVTFNLLNMFTHGTLTTVSTMRAGLPVVHLRLVENILDGMPIFLFNFSNRQMYGVFWADDGGGRDIRLRAFGRAYPAQVGYDVASTPYSYSTHILNKKIIDRPMHGDEGGLTSAFFVFGKFV